MKIYNSLLTSKKRVIGIRKPNKQQVLFPTLHLLCLFLNSLKAFLFYNIDMDLCVKKMKYHIYNHIHIICNEHNDIINLDSIKNEIVQTAKSKH